MENGWRSEMLPLLLDQLDKRMLGCGVKRSSINSHSPANESVKALYITKRMTWCELRTISV